MDKPRNFFKHTHHHLYNRGANKQDIFFERSNYIYFLKKLKEYKEKYKIDILAYCLMRNHFHLFVYQRTEELSISKFIASLIDSYTKSINKSYQRSGTLFESRIKSKQIDDEEYFKWVIKYILENPLKANLVTDITDWEFSNAKDLFSLRAGTLTNIEEVKTYFQNETQMKEFLTDRKIKIAYEI